MQIKQTTQTAAIAGATVRELLRRCNALILLVTLPLAFYLARSDVPSSALVVLALGVGWAVATLSLFSTVSALDLDLRLRVAGYSTAAIVLGRLGAVLAFGTVLSIGFFALAMLDQDVPKPGGLALMLLCAIVVGAPLGMATGLLLRRELEGMLLLLILLATQFMTNPEKASAHWLPLWSVRGVADWTFDFADGSTIVDGLSDGLLHAAATVALLTVVLAAVSAVRLRIHAPHTVLPPVGSSIDEELADQAP